MCPYIWDLPPPWSPSALLVGPEPARTRRGYSPESTWPQMTTERWRLPCERRRGGAQKASGPAHQQSRCHTAAAAAHAMRGMATERRRGGGGTRLLTAAALATAIRGGQNGRRTAAAPPQAQLRLYREAPCAIIRTAALRPRPFAAARVHQARLLLATAAGEAAALSSVPADQSHPIPSAPKHA
eukprot:363257-Chlamydomonas_euryale.AAC.12